MSIVLFDLGTEEGRPMSPYCWRIRESLALLSVEFESRLLGFREIREKFAGTHRTVPVLVDGDEEIGGSWAIAEYLSRYHDPYGRLFGGPGGQLLNAFVTNWVDETVLRQVNLMIVKDVHDSIRPRDREYFRKSEEKRQGRTLEETQSGREASLPSFQISLHPARCAIREQEFLGGPRPTYADFALHSTFQWVRAVSRFQLLRSDDRLHLWLRRMDDWLDKAGQVQYPGLTTGGQR